ncbi:site-specific DNA-methyltransferase [Pseudomonas sp. NT2]|uniref:DNA-methyltransferase n=1 Tax=Pseudomonas gorinensis TaxID=3240790 RepID=UPI0035C6EADC
MPEFTLHLGDCLQTMRAMPDNSVDSIVTDPPYGLSFMGKKWDYDVPAVDVWAECLRVLKPGGHLLAFAGTRTQHRMAVRIEDAGFEIRDMIAWVYGSGFPKSGNTALKPALEPITMARKPLIGTVAANALRFGTGPLNINDCRVEPTGESRQRSGDESQDRRYTEKGGTNFAAKPGVRGGDPAGRWPANLIHDGSAEVVAMFPQAPGQQGDLKETGRARPSSGRFGDMAPPVAHKARIEAEKSASRFFYCAKTSKKDRGTDNTHPTVKPTELMAYLLRLVTPPGGTALDPFMGSGSTGKAAMREGFRFIGCEIDEQYAAIARARIEREAGLHKSRKSETDQIDLFATA